MRGNENVRPNNRLERVSRLIILHKATCEMIQRRINDRLQGDVVLCEQSELNKDGNWNGR